MVEVSARYDELCKASYQSQQTCTLTLTPGRAMAPPIYVYYEIDNMYLNHRRMVLSRSDSQLRGDASQELSTCAPQRYQGGNGAALLGRVIAVLAAFFSGFDPRVRACVRAGSLPVNPCGLAAWSYINDSYTLTRASGVPLAVSAKGIAFKADVNKRFASAAPPTHFNDVPSLRGGGQLAPNATPLAADERFVAWMRTPALSRFRKLWGRIDGVTIAAGETITVGVANNWNSYGFSGTKRVVLSTSTWLGGANHFMGVAYLVVGGVCMALALVFSALVALRGRKLADPKYYSWNQAAQQ